jgi:hypothetical protein
MQGFREDSEGLFPKPTVDWVFRPRVAFTLMKDKSSAAGNAAEEVFCPDEIDNDDESFDSIEYRGGMCFTHANLRWVSNNNGKFKKQKNTTLFQHDLDYKIKFCPHINIVETMKQLFYKKWISKGEQDAVAAWKKEWHCDRLTLVELNEEDVNPLYASNPCTNNGLESTNNINKLFLGREKVPVTEFVSTLCQEIIEPESRADVRYHNELKRRSSHKTKDGGERNKAVRNIAFLKQCQQELKKDSEGIGNFLNLHFAFRSHAHSIPSGSFIILSRKGETDARSHPNWDQNDNKVTTRDYERFLSNKVEWVEHFKRIIKTPLQVVEELDLDLEEVHDYLNTFHIIRPIIHDTGEKGATVNMAIAHFLELMKVSGIPTESVDDVLLRDKRKGLVACTCATYLHYIVCIHTFCILKKRCVVTGWIPTHGLDPTSLAHRGGSNAAKAMGTGKSASLKRD